MTTRELRRYSFWLFLRMWLPKGPWRQCVKRKMCEVAYLGDYPQHRLREGHNFIFQAWSK